jgi:hypothetical protein
MQATRHERVEGTHKRPVLCRVVNADADQVNGGEIPLEVLVFQSLDVPLQKLVHPTCSTAACTSCGKMQMKYVVAGNLIWNHSLWHVLTTVFPVSCFLILSLLCTF